MIVSGAIVATTAALGLGSLTRNYIYLNGIGRVFGILDRFISEALDRLHIVEYTLQCNTSHEGLVIQSERVGQSFKSFLLPSLDGAAQTSFRDCIVAPRQNRREIIRIRPQEGASSGSKAALLLRSNSPANTPVF